MQNHMAYSLLILLISHIAGIRSGLVLHKNGALVPEDTPEVAAARELHLQAVADAHGAEEHLLATEEEAARKLGFGLRVGPLRLKFGLGGRFGGRYGRRYRG